MKGLIASQLVLLSASVLTGVAHAHEDVPHQHVDGAVLYSFPGVGMALVLAGGLLAVIAAIAVARRMGGRGE